MPQWTEQQLSAIEARNLDLLISAAAGSGKTAVLVERIVSLLREGASLDQMLIVTFTRAAASEMRQRLYRRLCQEVKEDPRWAQQLDLLPQAQISTIHGFCQTVLRGDFQAAGIDPLSRICTEASGETLFQQAMEEAMNDLFLREDTPCFHLLMESFPQETVFSLCRELERFLMSLPHPFRWLEEKINENMPGDKLADHPWYQEIAAQGTLEVEGLMCLWEQQKRMFDDPAAIAKQLPILENDLAQLRTLTGKEGPALADALAGISFMRAASVRGLSEEEKAWKDNYFDLRKEMKDTVKSLRESLTFPEAQTRMELCRVGELVQGLGELTACAHEKFQQKKRRRNLIDFSDLEQMTLEVLENEDVLKKVRHQWSHIFVDECQDVSAIQDAILQRVHGESNAIFMVGDVKQSIYRFRLADPTLFLGRMHTFGREANAPQRRITLQKNFRSTPQVLEAANVIFRKLFRPRVTELAYPPEEELIPGGGMEEGAPAQLWLIPRIDPWEGEEEIALASVLESEAQVCAEEILRLHGAGYAYRDMVLLMPKVRNVAQQVADLFTQRGIPVYCDMKGAYYDLPEIRAMIALLQVLDDPLQDIPLLATLKMPGFFLSDGELAQVRLTNSAKETPFHRAFLETREKEDELGKKCREIWERLEGWRFRLTTQSLSGFLWELMQETGYYAAAGALPEGESRQANLRLLCQRAMEYEQISDGSLHGFLQIAEETRESGDSRSAILLGEEENLVRIMTIHKSKGLEFPIVFVLGMEQKLHQGRESLLRCHNRLGVTLPYVCKELRIRRGTMGDKALSLRQRLDEQAERARLLYVAMTRAKERLYLLGSVTSLEKPLWMAPEGNFRVARAQSMLDWVMPILLDDPALRSSYQAQVESLAHKKGTCETFSTGIEQPASPWCIRVCDFSPQQPVEKSKVLHTLLPQLQAAISRGAGEKLGISWQDMYVQPTLRPLKTSVTSLVRQAREAAILQDIEETAETKRIPLEEVSPLRMSELPLLPAFLQEKTVTGAERGTLLHKAMLHLDNQPFKTLPPEEWLAEAERQKEQWGVQELFTPKELEQISTSALLSYYRSPLGMRHLRSREARQEWSFIYRMSGEDTTYLQGVLDCAFLEAEGWVLVDFKTDRVTDVQAFIQKYTEQLRYYAMALGESKEKQVKEAWLFALQTGRAYAVPITEEASC